MWPLPQTKKTHQKIHLVPDENEFLGLVDNPLKKMMTPEREKPFKHGQNLLWCSKNISEFTYKAKTCLG